MPVSTRYQIKTNILSTTQQDNSQIGTLVESYINMTLNEVSSTGWAFSRRWGGDGSDYNHLWNFLRRKTTFATVSGTTDYVMERDVDQIAIIRQTSTPTKLTQVPDEIFFEELPYPQATGNPRVYRIWEMDGLSTRLASADKINIVSSSTSDGSTFSVSLTGYVSGRLTSETLTLNGTTSVSGTLTFDAREVFITKSANTTGNITCTKNTGGSTLLVLGKDEISPRFKIVSLFPQPSSALTMYVEYYKTMRELVSDTDSPEFHSKWHFVVILGTLAKVYQHLGKTVDFEATMNQYASAVRAMVASDKSNPNLIEYLTRRRRELNLWVRRSEDTVSA